MRVAAGLLCAIVLAGCGRYFYTKPSASRAEFRSDSTACARDVGVPSGNGQYARVTREPFERCMLARGWIREQKVEPVPYGWFRGVEGDDVVDLREGPTQPADLGQAATSSVAHCRALWLEGRSDWRDRMPQYQACLSQ